VWQECHVQDAFLVKMKNTYIWFATTLQAYQPGVKQKKSTHGYVSLMCPKSYDLYD